MIFRFCSLLDKCKLGKSYGEYQQIEGLKESLGVQEKHKEIHWLDTKFYKLEIQPK